MKIIVQIIFLFFNTAIKDYIHNPTTTGWIWKNPCAIKFERGIVNNENKKYAFYDIYNLNNIIYEKA